MVDKTKRLSEAAATETKRVPSAAQPTKRMTEASEAIYLREGESVDERYEVKKILSDAGGEAMVYLCLDNHNDGREVVLKLYKQLYQPKPGITQRLQDLRHPDVIALLGFGKWQNHFYEVMEYARGGCVFEPGKPMSEAQVMKILAEINSALRFCHENSIVHRDLKPTNIFYRKANRTDVVLGDFGISSIMKKEATLHATTLSRTTAFAAPEVFHGKVGPKTDYYALGITIITLLKGQSPFEGWSDERVMHTNAYGAVPLPDSCSPRFLQLLKGLLTKTIDDRWGEEEVSRWLNGEEVAVVERTASARKPFLVGPGLEANSLPELAALMQEHWERGKEVIGRKANFLTSWVAEERKDLADEIHDTVEQNGLSADERLMQVICWLDSTRPYVLLPGLSARTPQELAALIDRDERTWAAGREQLHSGMIPTWLRNTRYNNFEGAWSRLKSNFKNQEQGLEAFLHVLKPDLPAPQIAIAPSRLDFGTLRPEEEKALTVAITNRGRGHLHGSIDVEGASLRVALSKRQINGNDNRITATVHGTDSASTGRQSFTLRVTTNASTSVVEIPCQASLAGPKKDIGAAISNTWENVRARTQRNEYRSPEEILARQVQRVYTFAVLGPKVFGCLINGVVIAFVLYLLFAGGC